MGANCIATEQPLINNQTGQGIANPPQYRGLFSPAWRVRLTGVGGVVLFYASWRWGSAEMARWSLIPGIFISTAGLLLRIWATGWLCKNETLTTTGPYS